MKKLDPRLQLVADFVEPNQVVADIGTDHAYLPVYLVSQGLIPSAIAADLREGPLSHAKEAVDGAGLGDQITLRLSDGLEKIEAHEADCIVMAGMGGILISQLIERTTWLKDNTKTLILQPMTDAPLLRSYLAENGFEIIKERATGDKKHCYTVIKAVYHSDCSVLTPLQAVKGKLDTPLGDWERKFLEKERAAISKQIKGITCSDENADVSSLAALYDELSLLLGDV